MLRCDGTQTICDDAMLAQTGNVWRSLHHPVKHRDNPVLVPDRGPGGIPGPAAGDGHPDANFHPFRVCNRQE